MKHVTPQTLASKKKQGMPIACVTAYDYITACAAAQAQIDMILVGDSLGMVILGYENTLSVTIEDIIRHTQAVKRGAQGAMVVADMPFMSYGVSVEEGVRNAGRFIKEACADAVKVEGASDARCSLISAMVDVGIPVLGHIGVMPQSVLVESGYHVKGSTSPEVKNLKKDIKNLEDAGVFGVVLECVKASVAKELTKQVSIPTISIGSGAGCDGQILVSSDILGLTESRLTFVKRYAGIREEIVKAFKAYKMDVEQRKFPSKSHEF